MAGNRTVATAQTGVMKGVRLKNISQRIRYENDKLVKLRQRCGNTRAESKRLKKEIDTLRRERIIFKNFYKKLVFDFFFHVFEDGKNELVGSRIESKKSVSE